MRIFDKFKKHELDNPDLTKGFLANDQLSIPHPKVKGVKEEGHYEVIQEYSNGGKDVKWVVDKPGVEAKEGWEELEDIQVYIPYTEEQLKEIEIRAELRELHSNLDGSDRYVIKCYDRGLSFKDEYPELFAKRQEWRDRINELEKEIE